MKQVHERPMDGLIALPAFPVVLLTIGGNIITVAAFHFYSFDPPSVMVGIKPEKYSHGLVAQAGEFAVNIPPASQLAQVELCGKLSGRDADKFAQAGFTPIPADKIDTLLIAECPVNLECRVVHRVAHPGSHEWFVGEILAAHIDSGYTRDSALMFWLGQFRAVGALIKGKPDDQLFNS